MFLFTCRLERNAAVVVVVPQVIWQLCSFFHYSIIVAHCLFTSFKFFRTWILNLISIKRLKWQIQSEFNFRHHVFCSVLLSHKYRNVRLMYGRPSVNIKIYTLKIDKQNVGLISISIFGYVFVGGFTFFLIFCHIFVNRDTKWMPLI